MPSPKPLVDSRRKTPRVVLLVENLPVPLDRRVWLEAGTLRDAGWAVVVIGPRGGVGMRRLRDRVEGIEVLRYPQYVASGLRGYLLEYIPSLAFSLAWLLYARARGPIDVIHGCNPPDLFWLFGTLGRLWGAKYVFDQHDPNPELSLAKFGSRGAKARWVHAVTRFLEQRSYRQADLVLTVNETCRDIAMARGGIPPERVVILRNSPRLDTHRSLAETSLPEGIGVGYVGVMGTHDGVDILIDAWEILRREPDLGEARLDLVGDGPARAALEARTRGPAFGGSVRWWGYLGPQDYVPILARCRIGVSPDPPNPFNDLATMAKIIDYLAIGRGCVAFDLRESLRLGGDAIKVVDGSDANSLARTLIDLLRNPAETVRLGDNARRRADEVGLDWEPYGEALVAAYSQLRRLPE